MSLRVYQRLAGMFYAIFPKPLSQDVIEVFNQVGQLTKLGLNDEDPEDIYNYLRIVDLCEAFKGELFRRGIMFTATDREQKFETVSEGDGRYRERCTVLTDFAVVRRHERLELGSASGSARDRSDKALAIAQTSAFKAFLKRASMTYGKEDDPETRERETFTPKESVRIASYQRRALDAALRTSGISRATLNAKLTTQLGFPIECEQIADLPRAEFDQAMKLILGTQDLTDSWSAAVVDIRSKKQQQSAAGD